METDLSIIKDISERLVGFGTRFPQPYWDKYYYFSSELEDYTIRKLAGLRHGMLVEVSLDPVLQKEMNIHHPDATYLQEIHLGKGVSDTSENQP